MPARTRRHSEFLRYSPRDLALRLALQQGGGRVGAEAAGIRQAHVEREARLLVEHGENPRQQIGARASSCCANQAVVRR